MLLFGRLSALDRDGWLSFPDHGLWTGSDQQKCAFLNSQRGWVGGGKGVARGTLPLLAGGAYTDGESPSFALGFAPHLTSFYIIPLSHLAGKNHNLTLNFALLLTLQFQSRLFLSFG